MGRRMGRLTWTRRYSFQSVHSLNSGMLKERRHGHQYYLEVTFDGREIDAIDSYVAENILSKLHAREVKEISPSTGECIVDWIHARLREGPVGGRIRAVALQETRKNRFVSRWSGAEHV